MTTGVFREKPQGGGAFFLLGWPQTNYSCLKISLYLQFHKCETHWTKKSGSFWLTYPLTAKILRSTRNTFRGKGLEKVVLQQQHSNILRFHFVTNWLQLVTLKIFFFWWWVSTVQYVELLNCIKNAFLQGSKSKVVEEICAIAVYMTLRTGHSIEMNIVTTDPISLPGLLY